MSPSTSIAAVEPRVIDHGAGIGAALSFAVADVLSKIVFASGMDVLSLIAPRGVLAAGIFGFRLHASPPRVPHSPQARLLSFGLGVLFAVSVFGLLLALRLMPLSVAILASFIYPLRTALRVRCSASRTSRRAVSPSQPPRSAAWRSCRTRGPAQCNPSA